MHATHSPAGGGVHENYQLFALSGSYQFGERYTLRMGIENLLDEEPPMAGVNPTPLPFPTPATHIGGGLGGGRARPTIRSGGASSSA